MTLLQVRDLSVRYEPKRQVSLTAVDRVSLDIHDGEFVGLIGESGSGKSTLAMALLRLLERPGRISGGSITFDGHDITTASQDDLRVRRWRDIATVFQSSMNSLNPVMRVEAQFRDAIEEHSDLRGGAVRDRVRELFEMVMIDPKFMSAYPHELSGGMKQRVNLALALANRPRFVLLDEPTTGLDVVVQRSILDAVRRLQKELGFAVLFISHDIGTVQEAGFAGLALMDHLIQIPQVGRAWEPLPEPFTVLGLLAGAAPGLELGTLVSPVTYRPAGVLAKTLATLDVLSGGRAFCGLGAGWWEREHAAYGLAFPPARERLDALETAAETLRALWAPGTKAYAGGRVSLPETTLYPRPVSAIPLIIGGGGEQRTLRIAARWGDACNLTTADPEVVTHKAEVLRRHCADLGRDPDEVGVTVLDLPVLGRDRDAVASAVERLRGRTPAAAFGRRHHAGLPDDHTRRYAALADLGVSRVFVGAQGLRRPEDLEPWSRVTEALG